MIELADYSLPFIFALSLILILAATEFGHWLGESTGERSSNVPTLVASILGLLALMISFTFAMALSRFDTRRDALLAEANAINTAALYARLLPAPRKGESLKLLRDYVQIRLDLTQRRTSAAEVEAAIARSDGLQEALWQQALAVAEQERGLIPSGLFIQSLNQLIDIQAKRLTAGRNRVPNIVLVALYGIAFVTLAFAGYAAGPEARRWRPGVYITGTVVAAVILLIQDLDRPTTGFIQVSQQPLIDAATSLARYTE
jgi:hypothetical protein